jgi:UDP-3-O-[3-hydroxymyristoyl] glucosamine N-acyltransferase
MVFKLADLARRFNGQIRGDPDVEIHGVATLSNAGPHDITYVTKKKYFAALSKTSAGAVILTANNADKCNRNAFIADNPRLCFAQVASLFNPLIPFEPGVHPTACVADDATVADDAWIGPQAVIEPGVFIGRGAFVGPGCFVSARSVIGVNTRLVARIVVNYDCVVGENCLLHPGVVIGSDGFGFAKSGSVWLKVPQLGGVRIGNDVEIGANTAIDRGTMDDTVIGNGVKLDNLIQIAHNVHIGDHTAIAACVGIAGSTHVGRRCAIGGQVAISDHLEITDDVYITLGSRVTSSINEPGAYSSSLKAEPVEKWKRNLVRLSQLDEMAKRLKALEMEIERLSEARKT